MHNNNNNARDNKRTTSVAYLEREGFVSWYEWQGIGSLTLQFCHVTHTFLPITNKSEWSQSRKNKEESTSVIPRSIIIT